MSAARTSALINSWETTRYELLNTKVCDLGLRIEGSPLAPFISRLYEELAAKGIRFRPSFYLTDSWGCPNQVPVIGIPFYLADKRLRRLEDEQTGEIEDDQALMMFLRHEAGHAMNYAYRLWESPDWKSVFGSFLRPYRDSFEPNIASREFVRHLVHSQHGRHYAQKHPDEDFAETFGVWLTPRSAWRRRYRQWPAYRKLRYVDSVMRQIRTKPPKCTGGQLCDPIGDISSLLAEHYGQRAERYRALAQGYVDDKLREIFPPVTGRDTMPVADLLTRNGDELLRRSMRWSGLSESDVRSIQAKIVARATSLVLQYRRRDQAEKLLDITSLAASLAMDFAYTGRFTA